MKKLLLAAALFCGLASQAQDINPDNLIKVNAEKFNFGTIKQGVPVTTSFEITNISDRPVVIENVTAGCGCTTPKWPQQPIAAGATAKIEVGYNAAAVAPFDKDVYVKLAGSTQLKSLKIVGTVLEGAAYDEWVKTGGSAPAKSATANAPVRAAKPAVTAKAPVKKPATAKAPLKKAPASTTKAKPAKPAAKPVKA